MSNIIWYGNTHQHIYIDPKLDENYECIFMIFLKLEQNY